MEMIPGGGAAPVPNINAALERIDAGQGTLADQATVMTGSATNLVSAAGSGFKLDPEAATALIASCDESLNVLRNVQMDLEQVANAPRLGTSSGQQQVASFTHNVASDHQGIVQAVGGLQATITQMRQAYQKAVANYQAIEQQVTDSVNKLAGDVKKEHEPMPQYGRMRAE